LRLGLASGRTHRDAQPFLSAVDAVYRKTWGGDPCRPRKRGSASWGVTPSGFQAGEAVGGPIFGADTVVDEEKAGGIVFFFDGF